MTEDERELATVRSKELRLAAIALRQALEAARGAIEIAGRTEMPMYSHGVMALASWLDRLADEFDRQVVR